MGQLSGCNPSRILVLHGSPDKWSGKETFYVPVREPLKKLSQVWWFARRNLFCAPRVFIGYSGFPVRTTRIPIRFSFAAWVFSRRESRLTCSTFVYDIKCFLYILNFSKASVHDTALKLKFILIVDELDKSYPRKNPYIKNVIENSLVNTLSLMTPLIYSFIFIFFYLIGSWVLWRVMSVVDNFCRRHFICLFDCFPIF